ncbi:hypothetical protein GCM10028777_31590 [Angustibacter speluncae]
MGEQVGTTASPDVRHEAWQGVRPDLARRAVAVGVALQVVLVVVALVALGGRWDDLDDLPSWANLVGPATTLPLVAVALVTAWRPRDGRGGRRGRSAPSLRAIQHLVPIFAAGFVVFVAALFVDSSTWPGVLLLTTGAGLLGLPLALLLGVVGPLGLLAALHQDVEHPRLLDRLVAVALLPVVVAWAVTASWAVPDESEGLGRDVVPMLRVLAGLDPAADPVRAWVLRLATLLLAALVVRVALVLGRWRRPGTGTRDRASEPA